MSEFSANILIAKIKELIIEANTVLRPDVLEALKKAQNTEDKPNGQKVLGMLIENASLAQSEGKPLCQDTGYVHVYFGWPSNIALRNDLGEIVNEAVKQAYSEKPFRSSIVADPLFERKNTSDNTPAAFVVRPAKDRNLKIKVLIKGAGSDNSSAVFMLNPACASSELVKVVVEHVKANAAKSCPPLVVGIGIGSSFDKVAVLSKAALHRNLSEANKDARYAELERQILSEINNLGIGPSGLGGKTTALSVMIKQASCHMASLPVAVNLNCYALRTAEATIGG